MSWGNMCDCTSAVDMHRLARACAGPTAQHFMHSTDWVNDVKGALLSDYVPGSHMHAAMHDDEGTAFRQQRVQMREDADQVPGPTILLLCTFSLSEQEGLLLCLQLSPVYGCRRLRL